MWFRKKKEKVTTFTREELIVLIKAETDTFIIEKINSYMTSMELNSKKYIASVVKNECAPIIRDAIGTEQFITNIVSRLNNLQVRR